MAATARRRRRPQPWAATRATEAGQIRTRPTGAARRPTSRRPQHPTSPHQTPPITPEWTKRPRKARSRRSAITSRLCTGAIRLATRKPWRHYTQTIVNNVQKSLTRLMTSQSQATIGTELRSLLSAPRTTIQKTSTSKHRTDIASAHTSNHPQKNQRQENLHTRPWQASIGYTTPG